jgi:hypothetical protein
MIKKALFVLFISLCANAGFYSDKYTGSFDLLLLGVEPDDRIEAMGKAPTGGLGEFSNFYYNPAYLASTKGISLSGCYINGDYPYAKPFHFNGNITASLNKYLNFGISSLNCLFFDSGEVIKEELNGTIISWDTVSTFSGYSLHSFSCAAKLNYDIQIGLTLSLINNYEQMEGSFDYSSSSFPVIDLGIYKAFDFLCNKKFSNQLLLEATYKNLSDSKLSIPSANTYLVLPIQLATGVGYHFTMRQNSTPFDFDFLDIIVQLNYRTLLNSEFHKRFALGLEFNILEILSLRTGYYYETLDNSTDEYRKEAIYNFTYGIGLNLPINDVLNNSLFPTISFDFASLKRPSQIINYEATKNTLSLSGKLFWNIENVRHPKNKN